MSKDITPAQANKAGQELAQLAPRPTSPLLVKVREILKAAGAREPARIDTTHYQEGGMRCKLYGYSMPSLPRGFKAKLARAGYKNISIISGVGAGFRHPCVTILASFGDQYCSPRSPVMRAKKGRTAQQLAEIPPKPKKPRACPCCGRAYK